MEEYELLKKITEIPAPSGEEQKRAEFIRDYLKQYGYKPEIDEAGNVLIQCRIDSGDSDESYSLMMAHMDTVFADQKIHVIRNDKIASAPGIGDDTANVVTLIRYLEYISIHNIRPKQNLLFAFNVGEEGLGNLKGIRQIMQDYSGKIREVVSYDLMSDYICTKAVGSVRYEVRVSSPGGHSYHAFGQKGAIEIASEMIHKIYRMKVPVLENVKSTYNVGMIEGGTSVNTIAQNCKFCVEIRSDARNALNTMNHKLQRILKMYDGNEDGVQATYKMIGDRPTNGCVDQAGQQKLIQRAEQAISKFTGVIPDQKSGSTDCNLPLSLGIPAISFGTYRGGGTHTREEWIDLTYMDTGFEIMKEFMSNYMEILEIM